VVIGLPQMKRLLEKFPDWEESGIISKSKTL
jgi:hypothetical protein